MSRKAIALVLAGALLAACSSVENPVTGKTERTVMSEQDEADAGTEQHRQVLADYGEVKDARLQAYVNNVGQKLARNSQRPELQWRFTVVDSGEVNAFALPGGYVYVTCGIMPVAWNRSHGGSRPLTRTAGVVLRRQRNRGAKLGSKVAHLGPNRPPSSSNRKDRIMNIAIWLIIGGLIGWVASLLMKTDAQQGMILNVVVGIVGAMLGGWLISPMVGVGTINQSALSIPAMLVSLVGAVILLAIVNLVRRGRPR